MGGTSTRDGVIERLKTRIGEHLRIEALILFGSRATGQEDESSDYDLIVVSPDFDGVPFLDRGQLLLPLREKEVSYDFLCYTPAEFETLSSQATMVRDAARTGVRLV